MQKLAHFWNLGPDSKFFLKANIKALIYSGLRSPLIGHYCLFHLYRQSSVKKPTSENTSSNNTFYISTLFTYLPKITLHPHQPWLTLNRAKVHSSSEIKELHTKLYGQRNNNHLCMFHDYNLTLLKIIKIVNCQKFEIILKNSGSSSHNFYIYMEGWWPNSFSMFCIQQSMKIQANKPKNFEIAGS